MSILHRALRSLFRFLTGGYGRCPLCGEPVSQLVMTACGHHWLCSHCAFRMKRWGQ